MAKANEDVRHWQCADVISDAQEPNDTHRSSDYKSCTSLPLYVDLVCSGTRATVQKWSIPMQPGLAALI